MQQLEKGLLDACKQDDQVLKKGLESPNASLVVVTELLIANKLRNVLYAAKRMNRNKRNAAADAYLDHAGLF